MVAVKLSVYVGEDRRVTIQLPDEVPVGSAELELTIQPETPVKDNAATSERERLRAKLIAAGKLVNPDDMGIPDDIEYVSDEELDVIGKLPPGAPTSEELVNEDRGEW